MDNDDQQQQKPAMIEEEPAHELYARLCGVLPASKSSLRSLDRRYQTPEYVPPSITATAMNITGEAEDGDDGNIYVTTHAFQKAMLFASIVHGPEDGVKKKKRKHQAASAPNTSQLVIDTSNRGYRLLSRMGFKEEEGGLGKWRQGRLEPILPKVKLDRRGVGSIYNRRRKNREDPLPGTVVDASSNNYTRQLQEKQVGLQYHLASVRRDKTARLMLRTDITVENEELHFALSR